MKECIYKSSSRCDWNSKINSQYNFHYKCMHVCVNISISIYTFVFIN